jgi:hypothetical protein
VAFARNADRPSWVYLDAQADARNLSRDALDAGCELFRSIVNDPDACDVELFNASERLRAFNEELARRDRVARSLTGTHDRDRDLEHEAWGRLVAIVKERVSVPDILVQAGVPMVRTGTSRGRQEFHGPCPVCGTGDDRLIAWAGPSGRVWCRRCGWSTDAIGAASLIAGSDFHACVRLLAEHAGIEVPDGR